MTEWQRARRIQCCGLCGDVLEVGAPIKVYLLMRGHLQMVRCGPCEGGAPPDLPTIIELDQTPKPPIDLTRIGVLPFDFKRAAAAEREPGEEG